ncbi:3D (Asp-Asp-Asp) domain-containing protein [Thermanaeromonas toyohensis ToBE]|uniref:3D (Asp-Asp-Asp) domain-containing protein n=1 Tax=Thermanaeromonas toyohensis ToBE TaxID=698762 RepID=A0A1W1VS79_9FIRM|nr:3D domain-containing protein [Thermanaeromonas toyohensis]SMB96199.1 3D (Asp-Asp-Asp) domain-containing protein [Thermanaeromonas toyohensis ToBE]
MPENRKRAAILLVVAGLLLSFKGDAVHASKKVFGVIIGEPGVFAPESAVERKGAVSLEGNEDGGSFGGAMGNPSGNPAHSSVAHRHNRILASRGGFSKGAARIVEMEVVATGYSASREEGTEKGITAIGTKARRGVVAVDPQVIPLGSEVYVPGYGWARAEDTGSAIRGHRIDLFFPTREEAQRWGVKKVKVIVHLSGGRAWATFKD